MSTHVLQVLTSTIYIIYYNDCSFCALYPIYLITHDELQSTSWFFHIVQFTFASSKWNFSKWKREFFNIFGVKNINFTIFIDLRMIFSPKNTCALDVINTTFDFKKILTLNKCYVQKCITFCLTTKHFETKFNYKKIYISTLWNSLKINQENQLSKALKF